MNTTGRHKIKLYQTVPLKKTIIFGTGSASEKVVQALAMSIDYFVDNNKDKWGKSYLNRPVKDPKSVLEENREDMVIVVASSFYFQISRQLINYGLKEDVHFINGMELEEVQNFAQLSMHNTLMRMKDVIKVSTVIDIGASDGRWSLDAMKHFPDSDYFLLEANQAHREDLQKNTRTLERVKYLIAAAGDYSGEIFFHASEDLFGGAASHHEDDGNAIRVPVVTVDDCVKNYQLKAPFMMKLDTHGFEIPIIKGAQETLQHTELLIIEVYNFKINEGLKFYELCAHMEKLGFRCADISSPLHRPSDHILWQMDMFFLKDTHPVFKTTGYNN